MGKYGEAAVLATQLVNKGEESSPVDAWKSAVLTIFPTSKSSQEKACPKSTYLGLCEAGAVHGVKVGSYTRSVDNKGYALKALSLLASNPNLMEDQIKLWNMVIGNSAKVENSQMDVVTALWENKLLDQKAT